MRIQRIIEGYPKFAMGSLSSKRTKLLDEKKRPDIRRITVGSVSYFFTQGLFNDETNGYPNRPLQFHIRLPLQ